MSKPFVEGEGPKLSSTPLITSAEETQVSKVLDNPTALKDALLQCANPLIKAFAKTADGPSLKVAAKYLILQRP